MADHKVYDAVDDADTSELAGTSSSGIQLAQQTILAQQITPTSSSSSEIIYSKEKKNNGWGFAGLFIGLLLIPFSLVCLWKNEKKIVTYHRIIVKAQKACQKNVNADEVHDENDLALVHTKGRAVNDQIITDPDFGVKAKDSYRLIRTVEMYQTKETKTENRKDKNHVEVTYHYTDGWHAEPISSAFFHETQRRNNNPTKAWPFKSLTSEADMVKLGQYVLSKDQALQLGSKFETQAWNDNEEQTKVFEMSNGKMKTADFQPFKVCGTYLVSTADMAQPQVDGTGRLGEYRVGFKWAPCNEITIIAQQVDTDKGYRTFRKWNPEKLNLPYGQETSADADQACDCYCCIICKCVNCFFNTIFEEVIYFTEEGLKDAENMFTEHDGAMKTAGAIIRPCSILACIFGFYLLFSPIIALLKWIPLVGFLLGWAMQLIAAIVALFVGGTVACLVLAMAWLFFRPCIGMILLTCVGAGIAMIFVIPMMLEKGDDGRADI